MPLTTSLRLFRGIPGDVRSGESRVGNGGVGLEAEKHAAARADDKAGIVATTPLAEQTARRARTVVDLQYNYK